MEEKKSVAEKLRKANKSCRCDWLSLYKAVTGELFDCNKTKCEHCFRIVCRELADMIEAERTKTEHDGVDVDALLKLADIIDIDLTERSGMYVEGHVLARWADTIRNAVKGAPRKETEGKEEAMANENAANRTDDCLTPEEFVWHLASCLGVDADGLTIGQVEGEVLRAVEKAIEQKLPEGVEWPRFEDGELVKFGDEFVSWDGETHKVRAVEIFCPETGPDYAINPGTVHNFVGGKKDSHGEFVKRPEAEVLDADGVPIKVGDTVYITISGYSAVAKEVSTNIEGMPNGAVLMVGANGGDGWFNADILTHRKPDTQEAIETDCRMEAYNYLKKRGICPPKSDYESQKAWKRDCRRLQKIDLLERQRKILGGE